MLNRVGPNKDLSTAVDGPVDGESADAALLRPSIRPRIAIAMATFNGSRFLDRQIATLAAQTTEHVDLWISDDGSTDGTLAILDRWRTAWNKGSFTVLRGPSKGFSENFRSLILRDELRADYFAFCDQDDVWDPDKLETAVATLEREAGERPGLYCSRTRIITEDGDAAGTSPLFPRPPSFRNAIVQNVGGGNTMVLNRHAWELIRKSAERTGFVSHDWWCYLMVSGAGGYVHYDPLPHVGYRQHAGNLVGDNMNARARADRLRRLMVGRFADWNASNVRGLEACCDLLEEDARHVLAEFKAIREVQRVEGAARFCRSGIYRQSRLANIALLVAIMMGRI